jgi:hypothetical protein
MLSELMSRAAAAMTAPAPMADVPNPAPKAPPEIAAKVDSVIGLVRYAVIAACVAGVFLVAGKAALAHRRGELHDVMGQLGAVVIGCVLVASGSALVGFLA